jgi:hypothetical protein
MAKSHPSPPSTPPPGSSHSVTPSGRVVVDLANLAKQPSFKRVALLASRIVKLSNQAK